MKAWQNIQRWIENIYTSFAYTHEHIICTYTHLPILLVLIPSSIYYTYSNILDNF